MSSLPSSLAILRTRPGQLGLAVCLFLIISLISLSTSSRHQTLQLPGLLPSGGPDLSLDPPGGGQPVYRKASLTAAQVKRYAHLKRPRIPGVNEQLRFSSGPAASGSNGSSRAAGSSTGAKGVIRRPEGKYLFVTLTRNIEAHLPDLLNTFSVIVSFLGPSHCRFSILEGPSDDRTASILRDEFIPMLQYFGVDPEDIVLRTDAPKVHWDEVHRIEKLAELRNEALSPLWKRGWDDTAAVVFFNDVFLRARDVLELLHQHVEAGAREGNETGATSGMDWYQKTPEYYYDIWVGRTMEGDIFYPIEGTSWTPSSSLFTTSPATLAAYQRLRPFQAFSTWGGMIVLAATPFLAPYNLRFRRGDLSRDDECQASECELLNRDLWQAGWGRVQVVPSVQVAYDRGTAEDIADKLERQKKGLGWFEEVPGRRDDVTVSFENAEPPESVVCYAWPEKNGLWGNVWELKSWGKPFSGYTPPE